MGWIPDGEFDIYHALLISASAVLTASIASLILGIINFLYQSIYFVVFSWAGSRSFCLS